MSFSFVTFPGDVRSLDGDEHFISHQQLLDLYGVPNRTKNVFNGIDYPILRKDGEVFLQPREDGKYTIENAIAETVRYVMTGEFFKVIPVESTS